MIISPTGKRSFCCYPGGEFHNNRKTHLHNGIDVNDRHGEKAIAPKAGRITKIYTSTSGGGHIAEMLTADGRDRFRLMHLGHNPLSIANRVKSVVVAEGDWVEQGQQIGWTGDSGNAAAVHIHYEHWRDGRAIDPLPFLREYQVDIPIVITGGLLYPKSEGEPVKLMQHLLAFHGFPVRNVLGVAIQPDGVYGAKTGVALKAFQKAHNLVADGICGSKTWAKLAPTFG
jgi:hypothetical protein